MTYVCEAATRARRAAREMMDINGERVSDALLGISDALERHADAIFTENEKDLESARAERLSAPMIKRLCFDRDKLATVRDGLASLARMPHPVGEVLMARDMSEHMRLERVRCPIGVLGIVFESRPDALVQIVSLCLRSGNAALLKGGREALRTNRALYAALREGALAAGMPDGFAELLETREDVRDMLAQDELIDMIIPRGSNAFVRYIMDNTRIPVMGHADGLCHVYVDANADIPMALDIVEDSKLQNVSVCNAAETLLVHAAIAETFLPLCAERLIAGGAELRGCARTRALLPDCPEACEDDWRTEYLAPILAIRVVDSLSDAIEHINRFGSHHTDAIITSDAQAAESFLKRVDSADVFHNCSTRFSDGFKFGFGAEVGIATGKLHARGPVGVEGLCTYKYLIRGAGQTVRQYTQGSLKLNT